MIRPPPRSPLFPYTALCRSRGRRSVTEDRARAGGEDTGHPLPLPRQALMTDRVHAAVHDMQPTRLQPVPDRPAARSEEHTSELQSRQYLVCRLLLEKKKMCNQEKQTWHDKPAGSVPVPTYAYLV